MAEEVAGKVVEAGDGKTDQSVDVGDIIADFAPAAKETPVVAKPEEGKEAIPAETKIETKVKEKVVEKPKEEAKPKEGEEKSEGDLAIEGLRAQVLELTEKLSKLGQPQEVKSEVKPEVKTEVKPEVKVEPKVEVEPTDFFESEEEYNKAFEDKATFNKVLSRIYNQAKRAGTQDAMRAVPQIINHVVKEQIPVIMKTEEFFKENSDLADKRQFVGYVANELSGKNPEWKLDKLFTELGKEVRTRLGLKQEAQQKVTGDRKPAFARSGGSRKPLDVQTDPNSLELQIADILPGGEGIRR